MRYEASCNRLLFCCVCLAMAALVGCGREGADRVVVGGTVTYRGEPLQSGRIVFQPTKGTRASLSGAEIVDGKYTVDARGGVPVGTHKVKITARRVNPNHAERGNLQLNNYQDAGGPPMQQYIPEKYNARTELEITIPPGSGEITQPFDLVD